MSLTKSRSNKVAISLMAGFAISFMLTLHLRPYPISYLIKSIPIMILSFLVFANSKSKIGRLVGIGLVFSAIGDVLLELHIKGMFIYGLIAFAIAHVFYISAFSRNMKLTKGKIPALAIILFYSIACLLILYPNLGKMLIPILAYLGVIVVMAICALLGTNNHFTIALGAGLFMISDSLIAFNASVLPIPYKSVWIMSTYYLAQILIAYGSIRSFAKPHPK